MLISNNNRPSFEDFRNLVDRSVDFLNADAELRPDYYLTRNGTKLEEDIYQIMIDEAKGTVFENTIELISNQRFPDIIASNYYGVEVKTSKNKNWTSTGSSIVESTRIDSVERIFLLFGKLSDPVEFRAKPYEECLSEIVVTHSPRYKIDMTLGKGETIFEKMDVKYDIFRKDDSSIRMVQNYYKSQLKRGQNLWWLTNDDIKEENSVPTIVKLWSTLEPEEKRKLQTESFAWFPEIFGRSQHKYNRLALWLVTHKAVVNNSLRDTFSAGGKMDITTLNHTWESQPHIFHQLSLMKEEVKAIICDADEEWLIEIWELGDTQVQPNRIMQWIDLVAGHVKDKKELLYDIFEIDKSL